MFKASPDIKQATAQNKRRPVFTAGILKEECDQWLAVLAVPAGKGLFRFCVGCDRLSHGIQCILDMGFVLRGVAAVAGKNTFPVKADDGNLHTGLFLQRTAENAAERWAQPWCFCPLL